MSSRSSRRIEPLDVQDILAGSGAMATRSATTDNAAASPSSPALSGGSSGRHSFQSHSRTMSTANEMGNARTNRFSLQFPIQPSGSNSPTRFASPTREAFNAVPEPVLPSTGPTDTNFLTAIATQERRVLELKEELMRAEADLGKLKRQWTQHEAQKKKSEARSSTKLQPLQTHLPGADMNDDLDGSSAWMQQEMERRKALLNSNKSSNRTVFSGSRHTRTLSLLSPVQRSGPPPLLQRPPRPPRKDSLSEAARRSQEVEHPPTRPKAIARASTVPDLSVDTLKAPQVEKKQREQETKAQREQALEEDILLQTGKKMATDFRDGLWTFWEDIRQATVGEEETTIHPPSKQNSTQTLRSASKKASKASLRPSSRGSSTNSKTSTDTKRPSPARRHTKSATISMASAPALADPSFWTDHGLQMDQAPALPAGKVTPAKHAKSPPKSASLSSNTDSWDTWDEGSPQASRASSAASEVTTQPSTVSGMDSPRASIDAHPSASRHSMQSSASSKKEPLPWPALSNLGPKALRRTASHLMSEWEKSLTPSPGKESSGQESADYLGLGAEAAAVGVPGTRR